MEKIMCGRYTLEPTTKFYERFKISNRLDGLTARYNIAPSQNVPVIIRQSPNRIVMMRWGLIPHWAKDESIGYKMINARAETITEKPAYRGLLGSKRCIVPASGFYEWQATGEKGKQPYYIHAEAGEYLPFAGLYDIWKNPEGTEIYSCTIITTQPTVNRPLSWDRPLCSLHTTLRLAVVDSTVLGVDQQIAKSRQTSSEVSDQKTAPLRLSRLHA